MLCAGQGGRGICKGDGGGPLVCNESGKWVLRGIASWTHPYCYTSYYSVFTRFSRFVGWMNNELSKWGMYGIIYKWTTFWQSCIQKPLSQRYRTKGRLNIDVKPVNQSQNQCCQIIIKVLIIIMKYLRCNECSDWMRRVHYKNTVHIFQIFFATNKP